MIFRVIVFTSVLVIIFASCRKEPIITEDPNSILRFSTDSILFDTVFTSVGSTTKRLKVYNPNKSTVRISNIRLAGAPQSNFSINVDGIAASDVINYELRSNDSMLVFIKVTIDPNASQTPFIVSDSILFTTNGNLQKIQLTAFGQNARFLKDSILTGNISWDKALPYVIYNSVLVDKNAKLSIEGGAKLHFHKNSTLFVSGTLEVKGTQSDSVIFQGDRLESQFSEARGQWNGIHLLRGSLNNKINYAVVKNAITGIRVDSLPEDNSSNPNVFISNTVIRNMSFAGILGLNARIYGINNLLFNCAQYNILGALGGEYDFRQNTFTTFNNQFLRQTPGVVFTDNLTNPLRTEKLIVTLVNNIIWGGLNDELLIDRKGSASPKLLIQTNLIRTTNSVFNTSGNLINQNPLFVLPDRGNFQLSPNSLARQKGTDISNEVRFIHFVNKDLPGAQRFFPSSLGCYE